MLPNLLLFPNGISEAVQVDFDRQPKTVNHLPQSLIFVDLVKMVVLCFLVNSYNFYLFKTNNIDCFQSVKIQFICSDFIAQD